VPDFQSSHDSKKPAGRGPRQRAWIPISAFGYPMSPADTLVAW
jgi:hypothetical protein